MWLLNVDTGELKNFEGSRIPPYAILSHRWEDGEITFEDMQRGGDLRRFNGYQKILFSCSQAARDTYTVFKGKIVAKPLSHVWIDTFCIKKSDSSELSEAINSMYKWYKDAAICYAYLSDVKDMDMQMFASSKWFRRGWTLQELLAPREVVFYDYEWNLIGKRSELSDVISRITNIPVTALKSLQFKPNDYSIADKMSWAAKRETGKEEDRAYSLLGLFEVNMPLIYGEGTRAFYRLQEEILKISTDLTIFAWDRGPHEELGALAATPDSFDHGSKCYRSVDFRNKMYYESEKRGAWIKDDQGASFSNVGLAVSLNLIPWSREVYLAPVCDIYETIDHYVHEQEPIFTVGMMLDRLQTGQYQRVSDDEQALFGIPAKVRDMKSQRITLCRSELQYHEEDGEDIKVIYRGLPNGPDTNGFQIVQIDPICPRLLQTSDESESLRILEETSTSRVDTSLLDQHISIFSRISTAGPGIMAAPHGTIGIAGYIRFTHPDYKHALLFIGYDFDYTPYCLLTRLMFPQPDAQPATGATNDGLAYIDQVTKKVRRMDRIQDIEHIIKDVRSFTSWQKDGIELRFASSNDLEMHVDLSCKVRVTFSDIGSTQPLQVVIGTNRLENSIVDGRPEELIEHRVDWPDLSEPSI